MVVVLADNPLLTVLGRRSAGAVLDELRAGFGPWTLRGLARAAGVPTATAGRVVDDLEALEALDKLRPGRDAVIRWRAGPVADLLRGLEVPDVRARTLDAFRSGFHGPFESIHAYRADGDTAGDPRTPLRIAILSLEEDEAWDAVGPALDAVREAGWPAPDVTVFDPRELDLGDSTDAAVLGDYEPSSTEIPR